MKAPAFTLPDQNGKPVSLEQFKGRKVVLYFYPKADTPGCTVQACGLRDSKKTLDSLGAAVIGVSPDETADLRHFEKKYNLNFPLLADPEHVVLEKYGVWKEKNFMGRRFMGVERTTVLIDENGNVIKRYDGVNPVTHAGMIMADLQQPVAKRITVKKPVRRMAKKTVKKKRIRG